MSGAAGFDVRFSLPVKPPFPPMEAKLADAIPAGAFQYEPKWDGFRCLAFREGGSVALQSKAGRPLGRYFPELVEAFAGLRASKFVLDGEIVVPGPHGLDFDALLQRIHPAESRIRKLARETPALVLLFDLLVDARGRSWVERPIEERRAALESFAARELTPGSRLMLSPATVSRSEARQWLAGGDARGMDGVVAKRLATVYRAGERDGMVKVKRLRTADCVVGGYRLAQRGGVLGALLLGLYDEDGLLHHVGFCSAIPDEQKRELLPKLESHVRSPGFTGRAPGGPSRWSQGRNTAWVPLAPVLVCEIRFDHFSGGRFRHGTSLVRWRPDKAPRQCTFEQLRPPRHPRAVQDFPPAT
jgi:ATP-dependent DNA ligase